jgi:hypothetical protein
MQQAPKPCHLGQVLALTRGDAFLGCLVQQSIAQHSTSQRIA